MANAKFYVGNFAVITIVLIMLGTMGMANDIYGDEFVVVDSDSEDYDGSEDYDFDIDRIRFNPAVDSPSESQALTTDDLSTQTSTLEVITDTLIGYDGGTLTSDEQDSFSEFNVDEGDFGYDYALAQYDVSDRRDNLLVNPNPNDAEFVYITLVYDDEQVTSFNADSSRDNIDLSGSEYDVPNIDLVEFVMVDESSTVDLSGSLDDGGVVGAANSFIRFLNTGFSYIAEVPSMIAGYISFTLAVPGTLGTFLRLYIGTLLSVFVVLELWIG